MEIGITLPNGLPGMDGRTLLDWAVRAERAGFSVLGSIGRVAYPSYDELITFAAAAGATERIRFMPTIMLVPTRDPVILAKQVASLDQLSGGRFSLGVGVGPRPDDYSATGRTFSDRGDRLDAMLETIHAVWRGEPVGEGSREAAPRLTSGDRVPIYFGAGSASERVIRRIARWGDGFIAAGSPDMVAPIVDALGRAWDEAGREGRPKLFAATYFVLAADEEEAERNIHDYYGSFMPEFAGLITQLMPRTAPQCKRARNIFEGAGFDGFLFSAAASDPAQVERLAEAVL